MLFLLWYDKMSSMRNATVQCDAETRVNNKSRGTLPPCCGICLKYHGLLKTLLYCNTAVWILSYQHFDVALEPLHQLPWQSDWITLFCITSFIFKSPNKWDVSGDSVWINLKSLTNLTINTLPMHTLIVKSFYKPMIILTPCGHLRNHSWLWSIFHIDLLSGHWSEDRNILESWSLRAHLGWTGGWTKTGQTCNWQQKKKQTLYAFAVKQMCHLVVFLSCQIMFVHVLTFVATCSFPGWWI